MALIDKADIAHLEQHPEHEAALAGALALANLFSNCVEAFGLIHPAHNKWEKDEQLLLSRLGIQQARLLIWGDIVGVTSPPKSVTDRAIPKHPSSAYPDLKEPTFFGPRDGRMDDPETRVTVEKALSALVDRSSSATREEMMEKYGLKPPKRFASDYQPALDTTRLDAFREKFELLKEVAETYASISTRRSNSIVQTSWVIADQAKFGSFILLTQEKVDFLINMLEVKERVDRGMRMDIKNLGWHLTNDRTRTAVDTSKLRLIQEACKDEYPEYLGATKEALDNINREARENMVAMYQKPYPYGHNTDTDGPVKAPAAANGNHSHAANGTGANQEKHKRPGLFGIFKSFGKSRDSVTKARSKSASSASGVNEEPERSKSDSGPATSRANDDDMADLEPIRSKSVGDILHPEVASLEAEIRRARLDQIEQIQTNATPKKEPLVHMHPIGSVISRHDQYHGIARTDTKDLRQGPDAQYE